MTTKEKPKTDKDGYLLLPETFEFKNHSFKFIKNLGKWKIYEKIRNATGKKYYELIKPVKREAMVLHGTQLEKAIVYPGTSSFGRLGYDCVSLARAEEIYEKHVIPRENSKEDEQIREKTDLNYSKGEFIAKDLVKTNKKLTYAQICAKIKEDVAAGKVKITGKKENKRGRASIVYKVI